MTFCVSVKKAGQVAKKGNDFAEANKKKPSEYQTEVKGVLTDGAPWDSAFCRTKWKSPTKNLGAVDLIPFYFDEQALKNLAQTPGAFPPLSSPKEKEDFLVVAALHGLQSNPVRKKEILGQNLPLSSNEPLTAMRFPIPGIRLDASKAFTRRLFERVQNDVFLATIESKSHYNRARPYQRASSVSPSKALFFIGHSSYPSGHATEAFVIVEICRLLWATHLKSNKKVSEGESNFKEGFERLESFAENYALNREIAGVHFRSDTNAGRTLGREIVRGLKDEKRFKSDLKLAQSEWK
jgi:hypothetical protein